MSTYITCVDDSMHTAFNNRMQSRDAIVADDILHDADGKLQYDDRAHAMFSGIMNDKEAGTIFGIDGKIPQDATKLVLYHWNRRYPGDTTIDITGWKPVFEDDFEGKSHEKITKTTYVRSGCKA